LVAIAYRHKPTGSVDQKEDRRVRVYSPFFEEQPYKVWKLATSHLLQANVIDFHIRVHLGLLHFTTAQYNVPIYNTLIEAKEKMERENSKKSLIADTEEHRFKRMDYFLEEAVTLFNDGLEQVNTTGTDTLFNLDP